jgi:hypothetical protein
VLDALEPVLHDGGQLSGVAGGEVARAVVDGRPDALNRIQPGRIRRELDHRQPVRIRPGELSYHRADVRVQVIQQVVSGTCNWWCAAAVSPA